MTSQMWPAMVMPPKSASAWAIAYATTHSRRDYAPSIRSPVEQTAENKQLPSPSTRRMTKPYGTKGLGACFTGAHAGACLFRVALVMPGAVSRALS